MSKIINLLSILEHALVQKKVVVQKRVTADVATGGLTHSFEVTLNTSDDGWGTALTLGIRNTVLKPTAEQAGLPVAPEPTSETILTIMNRNLGGEERIDLEKLADYNGLEGLFEKLETRLEQQTDETVEKAIELLKKL